MEEKVNDKTIRLTPYDLPGQDESRRYLTVSVDEKIIGYVQMTQIDLNMSKGCFSLEITDEEERGKGYKTAAVGLIKEYAGRELGISLLATIVDNEDEAQSQMLETQDFRCFAEQNGCRYYLIGDLTDRRDE